MSKTVKGGGVLKRSPIHLLHRTLQLGLDLYAQETGSDGLTQRQFAVLAAVAANDGLSQADLVRATGIDRSTVAELAARLTAAGLLARRRAAGDGRTNVVRLTEQGSAVLAQSAPKVARADKRLLKLLPGGKRQLFVDLMQALIKEAGSRSTPPAGADEEPSRPKPNGKAEPAAAGPEA